MQDVSVLGLVASRLAAVKAPPPRERQIFEDLYRRPRSIWRSFSASVILHTFVVFVLLPLIPTFSDSDEEVWRRHARTFRPLEIQIPDRLYLSSTQFLVPPRPVEEKPRRVEKKLRAPTQQMAKAAAPAPAPLPRAEPDRVLPKQFQVPNITHRPDADQTLIQPHLPPELQLTAKVQLPNILLSAPRLPRPAAKKFAEPGPSAPASITPRIDAPPALAGDGSTTSDLYIPSMVAGPQNALLRLPRPTIQGRPFKGPVSTASGQGSSVSPISGEPINVLALSSNPGQLKDLISIPLGNQIGRIAPPPAGTDDARGRPGIPGSQAGGTGTVASLGGGSGGSGTGTTGANGPGGIGTAMAGSGTGTGVGTGTGTGAGGIAGAGGLSPAIKYATPIRIEHPSNAQFDVVVMQSADEGFPESAGVLSGQPVYTVYLQVGAPRAWLLQYCIPKETGPGPRVVGGTVYIGKATPVKAPFPLVTVLPPVTTIPRASYIMVHGFVDKAGKFKDMNVLRAPFDQIRELLVPQLTEWVFRPATRDGVPVLVEILLAIPPHEG